MKTTFSIDQWELKAPFVTSQDQIFSIDTLTVYLEHGGEVGRGETLGVDYFGETARKLSHQVMAVARELDAGLDRQTLQHLLPPGGARNAVDCALWDLECKRNGFRAWDLAGLEPEPVRTLYTLSLDSAEAMAREAAVHQDKPLLKLKLDRDAPAKKIQAIRAARPDAELVIDANGAWSHELLLQLADTLAECRIALLEQPLPRGEDQPLDDINYPVPLCADESCQDMSELELAASRYDAINIKLDKCGGLTEGLAMVKACQERDLDVFVGNMLGSSLAMAPALLLGVQARWVDLDGPLWQRGDRECPLQFDGITIHPPAAELWG